MVCPKNRIVNDYIPFGLFEFKQFALGSGNTLDVILVHIALEVMGCLREQYKLAKCYKRKKK